MVSWPSMDRLQIFHVTTSGDYRDNDTARAWRGIGFVYIETGKLDEAEELYKKCLELNAEDKMAKAELAYIENLREKQK